MTKEHFHVRPNDSGAGWSVDHYDGRGAWVATSHGNRSMAKADAEAASTGAQRALQAHLDAVADALGAELMARFDGYHGECVKRLMEVAKASARYVASHRLQAVRLQGAEDKSEYVAAAKALDGALAELHGASEKR